MEKVAKMACYREIPIKMHSSQALEPVWAQVRMRMRNGDINP
jgi:hypothetical protein